MFCFCATSCLEIGEGRHWQEWVQIEILHAGSWAESVAILTSEQIDVVLLDLDLSDSRGLDTFRRAQHAAPGVPMILLVGAAESSLAIRLIRDGAQDFFVKKQVDCAPLAHAMQNAIERHRLLSAARAASTHDTLTGLLNRGGFLTAAERDRKLAERLGSRWMVMVAEPRNLFEIGTRHGEQRRDLGMVEAADKLRSLAGPADLIARLDLTRFAVSIFETEFEALEVAWARFHSALLEHRTLAGVAIFSASHPASLDSLIEEAISSLADGGLTKKAAAMRT